MSFHIIRVRDRLESHFPIFVLIFAAVWIGLTWSATAVTMILVFAGKVETIASQDVFYLNCPVIAQLSRRNADLLYN